MNKIRFYAKSKEFGMSKKLGWIGVDLDGTLAHYDEWSSITSIGDPVPSMVQRVKAWLAQGITVKIFTARVAFPSDSEFTETQTRYIQDWCKKHIGQELEITCMKDFAMLELWDDRCVQVLMNTGQPVEEPIHS
jgi:hypothetical protein